MCFLLLTFYYWLPKCAIKLNLIGYKQFRFFCLVHFCVQLYFYSIVHLNCLFPRLVIVKWM